MQKADRILQKTQGFLLFYKSQGKIVYLIYKVAVLSATLLLMLMLLLKLVLKNQFCSRNVCAVDQSGLSRVFAEFPPNENNADSEEYKTQKSDWN